MRTYFFPSSDETYLIYTQQPPEGLKRKIDKFCVYSEWNTGMLEDQGEPTFSSKLHGYIEDNKCYDNEHIFYEQHWSRYDAYTKNHKENFEKYKDKVNKAIDILETFYGKIKKYRDSKNHIKRMEATLEKGYVATNQQVRGSKRQRRFKKNSNLRYLTDQEIERYKDKITEEQQNKEILRNHIKPKKAIEDVFFTFGMTVKDMEKESYIMNTKMKKYSETIFLFKIFTELLDKFDKGIYNEALEDYKEVLKIDEEEKIVKSKTVKNKTRVYIDEDGNEHVIQNNVEQIIRTL